MCQMTTKLSRMTTASTFSQSVAGVVGSAIKTQRKTQREIAEASGLPLVTLNRKLSGHRPFTMTELAAVAEVLGTTVTDIVLRAEREQARTAA